MVSQESLNFLKEVNPALLKVHTGDSKKGDVVVFSSRRRTDLYRVHRESILYEPNSCKKCFADCCMCFASAKEVTTNQLNALLEQSANQRKSSFYILKSEPPPSTSTFDRGVETGYLFPRPKRSSIALKTMQMHREYSLVTAKLPDPSKIDSHIHTPPPKSKFFGKKQSGGKYRSVNEVNAELEGRTSVASRQPSDPTETSEAFFMETGPQTGSPLFRFDLVSSLLLENEPSLTALTLGSDSRRVSRPGSISLPPTTQAKAKSIMLDKSVNKVFLKDIRATCRTIKDSLEVDWSFTVTYVKTLESFAKTANTEMFRRELDRSERWMVQLFTTSAAKDALTTFRCLFVRFLLQHHCVVYEETDVGLDETELDAETAHKIKEVPMVLAWGTAIGGCNIMYAIHKLGKMKTIFGKFMIQPAKYELWRFNREEQREPEIKLSVSINKYPVLVTILQGHTAVYVEKSKAEDINIGHIILTTMQRRWAEATTQNFSQPRLWYLLLLRKTLERTYSLMNNLYASAVSK